MFTLDFAEDFSGLTAGQIKRLEDKGVLKPEKSRGAKYYTYGDIYILRVFKILQQEGIDHLKITTAFEYLKDLKPEDPLSSFLLFHDQREVYTVIDQQHIQASTYGQMMLEGTIPYIAVGYELEKTRRKMNRYVEELQQSSKRNTTAKSAIYRMDQLDKLFG